MCVFGSPFQQSVSRVQQRVKTVEVTGYGNGLVAAAPLRALYPTTVHSSRNHLRVKIISPGRRGRRVVRSVIRCPSWGAGRRWRGLFAYQPTGRVRIRWNS